MRFSEQRNRRHESVSCDLRRGIKIPLKKAIWLVSAGVAVLIVPSFAAAESTQRGTWFWQDSSHPYGSFNAVGTSSTETQVINLLNAHGISKVYGSYGNRPVDDALAIETWNQKLDLNGIESYLLLAEHTWIFPTQRPNLIVKLDDRLLSFNSGLPPARQFDGVHFDIEPHALADWDVGTPADKKALLDLLLDTIVEARDHLDANGGAGSA